METTHTTPEKRHTILVVDDHSDIRRLIRLTFARSYHILEAEDGEAALETVRRKKPDLVVLDIMMPGTMDGLQVLEAIKSDPELRSTLVIMVTARGQVQDYKTGMDKGADAYFVKPFSPLQLSQFVREKLE